jgi:hypothetical protein
MRRSWLRAAILGFLIGQAPDAAEASELDASELEARDSPRRSGHAVSGVQFHVWDEDAESATGWAAELVRAGADRLERARWRAIAAASAAAPPILTDEIEADLAVRSAAPTHELGISTLGCVVCLLPSLDRTWLISSWATSPRQPIRCALARALSAPFDAVGVASAITHLQADPSAEVRRLAHAAADARARSRPAS